MPSKSKAYEIVLRCIKAIAGKGEPDPDPHHTLEESGVSTSQQIGLLKSGIVAELAKEGLEFRKMSIDDINPSSTIEEVAHLVSYAQVKGERFY
jgi:hypothetical protein